MGRSYLLTGRSTWSHSGVRTRHVELIYPLAALLLAIKVIFNMIGVIDVNGLLLAVSTCLLY